MDHHDLTVITDIYVGVRNSVKIQFVPIIIITIEEVDKSVQF